MTDALNNGRILFLVDALGALLSSLMLGIVLPAYPGIFGMPLTILQILAFLALLRCSYGLYHYFGAPKHWQKPLKTLVLGNIDYCLLTGILVVVYWKSLFLRGKCYFVVELVLIVVLVGIERKYAKPNKKP